METWNVHVGNAWTTLCICHHDPDSQEKGCVLSLLLLTNLRPIRVHCMLDLDINFPAQDLRSISLYAPSLVPLCINQVHLRLAMKMT